MKDSLKEIISRQVQIRVWNSTPAEKEGLPRSSDLWLVGSPYQTSPSS